MYAIRLSVWCHIHTGLLATKITFVFTAVYAFSFMKNIFYFSFTLLVFFLHILFRLNFILHNSLMFSICFWRAVEIGAFGRREKEQVAERNGLVTFPDKLYG